MTERISEFDRIRLAAGQPIERREPASHNTPISGDAPPAEPQPGSEPNTAPATASNNAEPVMRQRSDNKLASVPAPPPERQALESYFKQYLGIKQALLLLEEEYPPAYHFATRGLQIRIDPTNTLFARGDDGCYGSTVVELLNRAAGRPNATLLDTIADYFRGLSAEERGVFRPDYKPDSDEVEDDGSFPVHVFPEIGREVINQMVGIHNVPPELPASMVLAVGSASLAQGLAVKSVSGLVTFANIMVIGGGPTGSGKSITSNPIIKPLRDFEAHLKTRHKKSLPAVTTRLTAIRARLEKLQNGEVAAGAEGGPTDLTEEDLRTEEAVLIEKLNEPTLIVDDATSEAMAKLAGQNNGTIASISSDARSAIKNLVGKHAKGNATDEDILLKGYSNEPIVQDRITRDRVSTVACFTIGWLTQPDNVYLLFDKDALADSGLLCRVLPFIFEGQRPPETYEEIEFPLAVSRAFHDRIWELAETYHQHRGHPHLISATPEARKILIDYDIGVRNLIAEGDLKWIKTFAVRLGEQAWRIALVLHGLEHGKLAHTRPVEPHSAKGAVEIVKWFFRQIETLFGTMVDKKADKQMDAAREFVNRHNEGVTARDVYRFKQGLFKDSDDARSTLQSLIAEGTIRAGDAGKNQRFFPRTRPKS